jgi:hypothetical protein
MKGPPDVLAALVARMEAKELQTEDLRRMYRELLADDPFRAELLRRLDIASAVWSELANLYVEFRPGD